MTTLSIAHGAPLEDEPGIGARTIPGYLREVAGRYGSREALVLRSGDERISWSYDELLTRSLDVAKALIGCGLGAQARVGILMTNRPEFLAALFGTALAGCVPVALSTFSTLPELDYLVRASEVSVLLFEQRVLNKDFQAILCELEPAIAAALPGHLASERFPFLQRLVALGGVPGGHEPAVADIGGAVEGWGAFLSHGRGLPDALVFARADCVSPADPGGIFFSSGTTSLQKGIAHAQRAFAIQWWRWPRVFGMKEPVRSWTGNGFFWSGNVSMVVGAALSTGGALVLQRYFDAGEALALIKAEQISFINGRPHQWARLLADPNWQAADLSSLKYITRGEQIRQHRTVHTDWEVPMSFGTTETMTICTSRSADTEAGDCGESCGTPLPGNTLKIVDPMTGRPVPVGERGEMCIKGPTLMTGYLGKAPEECFDSEGFYCSGDGGWLDAEGHFFWEGRLTDMIKTGGANVSPVEVDDVVSRFPGVKRTQTVGVPDALLGEMVVSCIVPVEGTALSASEITAFLKGEIASFKLPRRILFFTDEEYALTGNEKVKAAAVKEMAIRRLSAEKSQSSPT